MGHIELSKQQCEPCEGGTLPFTKEEARAHLTELQGGPSGRASPAKAGEWRISGDGKSIERAFEFYEGVGGWNAKWQRAASFVQKIAQVSGKEDHHPTFICLRAMRKGGLVEVKFSTHSIGGLSKNDFIMAAKLNELRSKF